jgi:soluble lytic murein transglycosylase-like protein
VRFAVPFHGHHVVRRRRLPATWALALSVALLCGRAACAQVFEVGAGGAIREVGTRIPPQVPHRLPSSPLPPETAAVTAGFNHDVSAALVDTVARRESAYHAGAVSRAGAIGLMQLMPATARSLGVDPRNPSANMEGGALYLRQQITRFGGRIDLALAAYNAGPGAVEHYGGIPPYRETRAYVAAALDRLADLSLALPHPNLRSLP